MTRKILGPEGSKRRKRFWLVPVLVAAIAVVFYVTGAQAVLPGSPSKFEGGNDPTTGLGNMTVDTSGNTDWVSVQSSSNYVHLTDVAASTTDDSFTPGQKQDTTCPSVETHKNPPKDDFTDVASFTEGGGSGPFFLYGATIRYAANGNASENIELKQGTSGFCAGSTTLLARTDGDKLLAIDYLGGGSAVQFHVLTWVSSGPCNVANDPPPCWGATVLSLDPTVAEGGVNTVNITAANNPISGTALVAGQFAEFGVNLVAAGIIPSGSCRSFSQTIWESRSSGSSFVSSTKDITIEDKDINNCATIRIHKVTNPAGGTGFGYTTTGTLSPATFSLDDGGTQEYLNVNPGSYSVTESSKTGWNLKSLTCTTTGTGTSASTAGATASITMAGGGVADCTYTNEAKGSIAVKKVTNPAASSASFGFTGDAGAQSLTDGQTSTPVSVNPGTYTELEATRANWDLTDITCSDSDSTGNTGTRTATFNVQPGENVVCTYTNVQRGSIAVKKVTDPSGSAVSFGFTGDAGAQSLTDGQTSTPVSVAPGTYTELEATKADWNLTSISCSDSDSTGDTGTRTATFKVAAGENVVCTFTNKLQLGAIKITKTSSKGAHPGLAGAKFDVTAPGGAVTHVTTAAGGTVCVDQLSFGTYSVKETDAPTGYAIDDTTAHDVTVSANSTCGDGNEATFAATDTPVADIQVNFRDGGSGATSATIDCNNTTGTGSNAAAAGWQTSRTVTGVKAPTIIVCTINIDP